MAEADDVTDRPRGINLTGAECLYRMPLKPEVVPRGLTSVRGDGAETSVRVFFMWHGRTIILRLGSGDRAGGAALRGVVHGVAAPGAASGAARCSARRLPLRRCALCAPLARRRGFAVGRRRAACACKHARARNA